MHTKPFVNNDSTAKQTMIHLFLLQLIALAIGIYLIASTAIIARDGVAYIHYAKALFPNLGHTISVQNHHPGYPFLIQIAHATVSPFYSGPDLSGWIYSGQIVTLLFRLLSLGSLYFLCREFVSSRLSFYSVLITIFLPLPAAFGSDVLSDWPCLFFLFTGMICLLRAVKKNRLLPFALSGACAGIGYLIRPESVQLLIYGFVWLLVFSLASTYRIRKSRAVIALFIMSLFFVIFAGPYMQLKGAVFPKKNLGSFLLSCPCNEQAQHHFENSETIMHCGPIVSSRISKGLYQLWQNSGETLIWYFFPFWFLGMCHYLKNRNTGLIDKTFLYSILGLYIPLMLWLYNHDNYMGKRHSLPLILMTVFCIPQGLASVASWLNGIFHPSGDRKQAFSNGSGNPFFILLITGLLICTPKLLKPIRIDKQGYLQAAQWLKEHTDADNRIVVLDVRIGFYAERQVLYGFREYYFERAKYVVQVIKKMDEILPYEQLQQVYSCPLSSEEKKGRIIIYRTTSQQAGRLIGPWQLFVDDHGIEEKQHVFRTYHPFQKHSQNPVLVADKAWEKNLLYICGTVLPREESSGYRMWYQSNPEEGVYQNLYAFSENGTEWVKPKLRQVRYQDTDDTNILHCYDGGAQMMQVIHAPWEPDHKRRYKLIICNKTEAYPNRPEDFYGAYSSDGVHCEIASKEPILRNAGHSGNFVWDPHQDRYIGYTTLETECRGHQRGSIGFSTTNNFENWTGSEQILIPDEFDDRWVTEDCQFTSFCGLSAFAYESMYLGFLRIARGTEGMDNEIMFVELVSSRDGVYWKRQEGDRIPILLPGEPGQWDAGRINVPNHPLVEDEEIKLWYSGFDNTAAAQSADLKAGIGLATLRKDGFVSLKAKDQEGIITTKPLTGARGKLFINANTDDGWIQIELLDLEGNVIDGYERNRCRQISGDGVRIPVAWDQYDELPVASTPIRIRFILYKAEIYSFLAGEELKIEMHNTAIEDATNHK